jgi:hypothetical protein
VGTTGEIPTMELKKLRPPFTMMDTTKTIANWRPHCGLSKLRLKPDSTGVSSLGTMMEQLEVRVLPKAAMLSVKPTCTAPPVISDDDFGRVLFASKPRKKKIKHTGACELRVSERMKTERTRRDGTRTTQHDQPVSVGHPPPPQPQQRYLDTDGTKLIPPTRGQIRRAARQHNSEMHALNGNIDRDGRDSGFYLAARADLALSYLRRRYNVRLPSSSSVFTVPGRHLLQPPIDAYVVDAHRRVHDVYDVCEFCYLFERPQIIAVHNPPVIRPEDINRLAHASNGNQDELFQLLEFFLVEPIPWERANIVHRMFHDDFDQACAHCPSFHAHGYPSWAEPLLEPPPVPPQANVAANHNHEMHALCGNHDHCDAAPVNCQYCPRLIRECALHQHFHRKPKKRALVGAKRRIAERDRRPPGPIWFPCVLGRDCVVDIHGHCEHQRSTNEIRRLFPPPDLYDLAISMFSTGGDFPPNGPWCLQNVHRYVTNGDNLDAMLNNLRHGLQLPQTFVQNHYGVGLPQPQRDWGDTDSDSDSDEDQPPQPRGPPRPARANPPPAVNPRALNADRELANLRDNLRDAIAHPGYIRPDVYVPNQEDLDARFAAIRHFDAPADGPAIRQREQDVLQANNQRYRLNGARDLQPPLALVGPPPPPVAQPPAVAPPLPPLAPNLPEPLVPVPAAQVRLVPFVGGGLVPEDQVVAADIGADGVERVNIARVRELFGVLPFAPPDVAPALPPIPPIVFGGVPVLPVLPPRPLEEAVGLPLVLPPYPGPADPPPLEFLPGGHGPAGGPAPPLPPVPIPEPPDVRDFLPPVEAMVFGPVNDPRPFVPLPTGGADHFVYARTAPIFQMPDQTDPEFDMRGTTFLFMSATSEEQSFLSRCVDWFSDLPPFGTRDPRIVGPEHMEVMQREVVTILGFDLWRKGDVTTLIAKNVGYTRVARVEIFVSLLRFLMSTEIQVMIYQRSGTGVCINPMASSAIVSALQRGGHAWLNRLKPYHYFENTIAVYINLLVFKQYVMYAASGVPNFPNV